MTVQGSDIRAAQYIFLALYWVICCRCTQCMYAFVSKLCSYYSSMHMFLSLFIILACLYFYLVYSVVVFFGLCLSFYYYVYV